MFVQGWCFGCTDVGDTGTSDTGLVNYWYT